MVLRHEAVLPLQCTGMPGFSGDEQFERANELWFLRSVHAATSAAFQQAAFRPPHEVYIVLARELESRGIEPDPRAVYAAAHRISNGRQPPIVAPGQGRRRREVPGSTESDTDTGQGSCASRRLGLPPTPP